MDDILEKITINVDSDCATFVDNTEFYVDIIDDIKNCIYIKTLKTEIFVKSDADKTFYSETSIFNNINNVNDTITNVEIKKNVFNTGDYLYISLNDIKRINTISKKITFTTFNDIETDFNDTNYGFKWTKVSKYDANYYYDSLLADTSLKNISNYAVLSDMYALSMILINKSTSEHQNALTYLNALNEAYNNHQKNIQENL